MTGVLSQIEKDLEELRKKEEESAKVEPKAEEKPIDEPAEQEEIAEPEEPASAPQKEDITPDDEPEPVKQSGNDAARERIERKKRDQILQEELERERAEKREMAIKLARLEGRDEVLRPAQQAQQVDSDPMPEIDPFDNETIKAALAWQQRQTMKQFAPLLEEVQQTKQHLIAKEAEGAWKEMNNSWQGEDRTYKKSYDFIIEKARDDLKAKNPNANDKQIDALLRREEYQFVEDLSRKGMNVKQAIKVAAMELAEKEGIDFFSYVADKQAPVSDRATPNIREVVENKKRSGSFMEVGAGTARPKVGAKEIAAATLDELMHMKPEDFARARKEAADMGKRGEVLRA
jgi:hypothetical protein